jgi:hypothetical protein
MADVVEQPIGLYEADEHAWIGRQIASLRDGDLDRLDRANPIAFLTEMAQVMAANWDRGWSSSTPMF